MDRTVADKWFERGIVGLVLAILVFTPLAFGGRAQPPAGIFLDWVVVDTFQVAQWFTIAALGLWGLRLLMNPRPKLLWPPICWAVLAFMVYAVIRYLTADIEYVARQELIHILVYGALFFIILNNLHRQETVQLVSLTLVFLAMGISAYAFYQFLTHSTRVWHVYTEYTHRASGTYICPNHLGGFLELLLPLGLAFTVAGRLKPVTRIFLGYSTLVIIGGIAASVSRGTAIATVLALAFFFGVLIFHRNYRLPAILFLGVVIGAAVVFMPRNFSYQARYKSLISAAGQLDDDLRFFMWEPALKVWHENILWGGGPAHFDYRFRLYRPEIVQRQPDRVHNDYLNVLADWGVVGAALISAAFGLLGIGVLKTWRVIRNTPDIGGKKFSNKLAFVVGASAGLAAILLHSWVDFNMYIPANAMIVVALMAFLSSHLRFATERYWVTVTSWPKILAMAALLVLGTYLGKQGVRHAKENYWLARFALGLPEAYSPAQVAVLEKAFAIEPMNPDTTYAIGEAYLVQSKEGGENVGGEDYKNLAAKAMEWYGRGMKLNPWDGYNFLRYGWCLDWTGRQSESGPYFDKAEQLDPNGYFTMNFIGLHYVDLNDFAAAKPWFERSLNLEWNRKINDVPVNYLAIVNRKLLEDATNEISARLSFPSRQP